MFFSDNLGNIDHCFFSRLGGVSLNSYKSLNSFRIKIKLNYVFKI